MAIIAIKRRDSFFPGYEYNETIADGLTGNDIYIPALPSGRKITCRVIAGANTGKFQTTTSSQVSVLAGTATWVDWARGDSTGTITDVIYSAVTGVRGVSISGEITIEVII